MPTKLNLSSPTGPHLGESTFRRMERLIAKAIDGFPGPTELFPEPGMAVASLASLFRNACNGAVLNLFHSSVVDVTVLTQLWPQMAVRKTERSIVVARRDLLKTTPEGATVAHAGLTMDSPTAEQFLALCVLHRDNILTSPTKVRVPPDGVLILPGNVLEPQFDGTFLLL